MLARTRTSFCKQPRLSLSLRSASTMVTRPADWKSRAPAPLPNTKTFAGEATLPSLPVPDLDASLDRLKNTLRPLARSPEELKAAESKIEELRSTGIGKTLQERLLQRKEEKDKIGSSWLEEWWDDAAYLTYRDPVVINVSYYYGFTPHPAHLPQTTSHRAAALTRSAMLFRQRFKRGEITPDATKEGPMCMDTWRWMFDCCRVPGTDGKDFSVSFAQAGDTGDSGHVVVIRNGRLWRLDASAPGGGLLGTEELQKQFEYIYQNSQEKAPDIIKTFNLSPDSWAQLVIQLAFWRLSKTGLVPGVGKGELVGTYEAATTRKFRKGRTETIRVVSDEVKAFCEGMDSGAPAERKIALFRDAARVHIQRAREGGNAMGVDRHMFACCQVDVEHELNEGETMPSIFSDPLYQRAAKWTLSTSAIFSKHFPQYGWGEVVPDGFGVAYMTGYNNRMQFTITSRKEMPSAQFREEIKNAGMELYALLSHAQEQAKAKM
ncbi:hypothetical protein RSAG8_07779, partial [Rhizoctonia solani AG-8 WAC10335]